MLIFDKVRKLLDMKKNENKKGFSISLLPSEYEALTSFAESQGDSFSAWARKVLKREINEKTKTKKAPKSKKSAPPNSLSLTIPASSAMQTESDMRPKKNGTK